MTGFDFEQDKLNAFARLSLLRNAITQISPDDKELALIDGLLDRLHDRQYQVAVVGEFNRGKSSLINALLGMRILPEDITPTTATINRIVYSQTPYSRLELHSGESVEVPIDSLKKYVTKLSESAQAVSGKVKEAVIGYPTVFCRNNIAILDTPGLNESEDMDALTYETAEGCDVLIYAINAQYSFSESESVEVCRFLGSPNVHHMVFTVGFIDMIPICERERVLKSIKSRIKKLCTVKIDASCEDDETEAARRKKILDEAFVFAVSAKEALEAFVNGSEKLEKDSGIEEYKTQLMMMLTANRDEWFAYEIQPYVDRLPDTFAAVAERLYVPLDERISAAHEHIEALRGMLGDFHTRTLNQGDALKNEILEHFGFPDRITEKFYGFILENVKRAAKNIPAPATQEADASTSVGGFLKSFSKRAKEAAIQTGWYREATDSTIPALVAGQDGIKAGIENRIIPSVQAYYSSIFEPFRLGFIEEIFQISEHLRLAVEALEMENELEDPVMPLLEGADYLSYEYEPILFDQQTRALISGMKVGNLRIGAVDDIAKNMAQTLVNALYPHMTETIDAVNLNLSGLAEKLSAAGLALLPRLDEAEKALVQKRRQMDERIKSVRELVFPGTTAEKTLWEEQGEARRDNDALRQECPGEDGKNTADSKSAVRSPGNGSDYTDEKEET